MTYWESYAHSEAWRCSEAFKMAHRDKPPKGMFAAPHVLEMTEVVQSSYSPHAFFAAFRNAVSESDEVA
jgi:heme-degrading monooxygenase HmoA